MMKLRLIIGQQIAMLRKKHGLTIRELSELSGKCSAVFLEY